MLSDSYLNPILPEACQFSSVLHSEGALTHSLNLLDEYSYRTYIPEAVNITDKANITLHCSMLVVQSSFITKCIKKN